MNFLEPPEGSSPHSLATGLLTLQWSQDTTHGIMFPRLFIASLLFVFVSSAGLAQEARLIYDCRDAGENAYYVSAQIFEDSSAPELFQVRVSLRNSPRANPFLDQVFASKRTASTGNGHLFTSTSTDLQIQIHPEEFGILSPYYLASIRGSVVRAGSGEPSHLVRCTPR